MNEKKGWVVQDVYADYHEIRARCYCIEGMNRSTTEVRWSCDPKKHPELLGILDQLRQYVESHLPELPDEFTWEIAE